MIASRSRMARKLSKRLRRLTGIFSRSGTGNNLPAASREPSVNSFLQQHIVVGAGDLVHQRRRHDMLAIERHHRDDAQDALGNEDTLRIAKMLRLDDALVRFKAE